MKRWSAKLGMACLIAMLAACSNNTDQANITQAPAAAAAEKPARAKQESASLTMEQQVDDYMDSIQFSGAILIVTDNKLRVAKGYRLADIDNNRANDADTVFQIASTSKAFTAAAILQLQEQGKLTITEPVRKYLPDYPYDQVTIHQLLTHTAGIPNFTELPGYFATMNTTMTVSENLNKFINAPLEFEPGSRFKYSNSGYNLLGAVIEAVSGQPFGDYLSEHILVPLGMTRSGYLNKSQLSEPIARGYTQDSNSLRPSWDTDMTVTYAAGGLYSTVNDLYKWVQGLESGKVMSASSWAAMRTPNKQNYALGWAISPEGNRYFHNGHIPGFLSLISRNLASGDLLIVLSNDNSTDMDEVQRELASLMSSE
ncbi:beta-lactamase family protein [Paenibacillus oenotherae]|uniref:Beta-lactamase family protein n=1 Tax=Paenibacillus oenotherae TaxID=1435645 RepID=A0ABS7D6X6_9BACL|nr:serine hydrolase domain-containing protein [Paenibacillus oenotherae]MBW7475528.1 beta-lactamase family protein [Paenibacillus oenotherae]